MPALAGKHGRVRELVAMGPPSVPAPPPPPPPATPRSEERADSCQGQADAGTKKKSGSQRTGRARGKGNIDPASVKIDKLLEPGAAAAAPSPSPELPVVPLASPREEELGPEAYSPRGMLDQVYMTVATAMAEGSASLLPQQLRRARPSKPVRTVKQARVREEPPRRTNVADAEQQRPGGKDGARAAASSKEAVGPLPRRPRKAERSIYRRLKQKVSDLRCVVRRCVKRCTAHLQALDTSAAMLVLGASMVFFIFSLVFFSMSLQTDSSLVLTRPTGSSLYAWPATLAVDRTRRVGPMQQRLDVEAARVLAVLSQDSSKYARRTSYSAAADRRQARPMRRGGRDILEAYEREAENWRGSGSVAGADDELSSLLRIGPGSKAWAEATALYKEMLAGRFPASIDKLRRSYSRRDYEAASPAVKLALWMYMESLYESSGHYGGYEL